MTTPDAGQPGEDRRKAVYVGGADAVEKTTYVVGEGTEPEARATGPVARGVTRPGLTLFGWIALALAAALAIVYAVGAL